MVFSGLQLIGLAKNKINSLLIVYTAKTDD